MIWYPLWMNIDRQLLVALALRLPEQIIRTGEGEKKLLKGAVACLNPMCPGRISAGRTTVNKDYNGAKNIALVGFSCLISEDQLPLPPFRRGFNNNSNK